VPVPDRQRLKAHDPDGMLGHVMAFHEHLKEADATARETLGGLRLERPSAVVVAGMGGSAIAADLVRGAFADALRAPMLVSRGYSLPAFVGPDTLVVASSYSGNTEETLAAHAEARERGARVVCMTTGGVLGELADGEEPVVPLRPGLPPRASLGFGLVSLLHVLSAAGLIDDPGDEIQGAMRAAVAATGRFGPDSDGDDNEAWDIATWFAGGVPVIYGAEPATTAAATRWVGQLSENAKTIGHAGTLPEMNHNEIVGYGDDDALGGSPRVVFLRDRRDHERIAARVRITATALRERGVETRVLESSGTTRLARVVSLVLAGDYVSVYLAALRGVDPTPVKAIDRLKRALTDA